MLNSLIFNIFFIIKLSIIDKLWYIKATEYIISCALSIISITPVRFYWNTQVCQTGEHNRYYARVVISVR